jgi:hypothetical protein
MSLKFQKSAAKMGEPKKIDLMSEIKQNQHKNCSKNGFSRT